MTVPIDWIGGKWGKPYFICVGPRPKRVRRCHNN